ncbi:MAG: glycoside hydrolase family 25 protein [Oscillospiraceae bacterium]|nr:glycoside hydrolase family 25 protein [Oscillospiraceae bacterium]
MDTNPTAGGESQSPVYFVVDISTWQRNINWQEVKAAGVQRVVIRQGFRGYGGSGRIVEDNMADSHYKGARSAGLPVDIYFFSQSVNDEEALEEANTCISWAAKRLIDCIYIDIEAATTNGTGRADSNSRAVWTSIAETFCAACAEAGYWSGVYANLYYWRSRLDYEAIGEKGYLRWLAHYTDAPHPEYAKEYDMWQYTSQGRVDGIPGNVDLNRLYKTIEPPPIRARQEKEEELV